MSTITGTVKKRTLYRLLWCLTISLLVSCTSTQQTEEDPGPVKSDVRLSAPVIRTIEQTIHFRGVSQYLSSNDIRTRVSGIIETVNCQTAGSIAQKQLLFVIQPMEAAALQKSNFQGEDFHSFSDSIYSFYDGTITGMNVQAGDFVQAGDVLATCIHSNALRVIVYVPSEQCSAIKPGTSCTLKADGKSEVPARIIGQLPVANGQDQTLAYIAMPSAELRLPEGMSVDVNIPQPSLDNALLVPKPALVANEMQNSFWVMKQINDSTCVKTVVTKGWESDSLVQILGNGLSVNDKIVSEGAYGLADTALIRVIQ